MTTNHTQSSSEGLREYFKKIVHLGFDPVFLKLNQDIDELVDKTAEAAMIKFTSHLQAYTDEIRREVIEWGSWLKGKCDLHKKYTSACCGCQRANHAYVTNQQRIEWSLEALDALATKWGVK